MLRMPFGPARLPRTRRRRGRALAAAILALAVAIPVSAQATAPADDSAADAGALVDRFLSILSGPDEQKRADLDDFLAPEFQLIRADATRLDRDAYIADPASVTEYSVSDLEATAADGIIVATYLLSGTITIDGVTRTTVAPRLSVFSLHGDGWQISAHANFSPLAPDAEASPAN